MEANLMPLTVQAVTQAIPLLLKFPMGHFSVDYDKEADVLYISFRRPQRATDTQEVGEGVLLRYRGEELVGMTILEASTRAEGRTALPEAARTPVVPRRRSARRQP